MGGSASSQSTHNGDIDNCSNEQSNYGLINVASKSLNSSFNLLEIVTFILVGLEALYFLWLWCKRRRRKKLESIRTTLQELQVVDHNPQIHPHAARIPVIQSAPAQPPLYPSGLDMKSPQEIQGSKIMSQYN